MELPVAQDASLAADAMMKLADELRALTTGAIPIDPDRPTQRVSVMHKVPRSILDVVSSQFEVMQKWLEPILSMSQGQSLEIQQLRQSLDAALANYSALLDELGDAEKRKQRETSSKRKPSKKKRAAN